MAIRQICYTVTEVGIEPSVKQFGGLQGEHKATEVIFELSSHFYQSLQSQAEGGQLMYRVKGYDGEGGCASTVPAPLPLEDDENMTLSTVTYPLEEWITRHGGLIKVVLVITLLKENETEMELFSFPAIIQLKNQPAGKNVSGENFDSPVTLERVIQAAVDAAYSVREDADNGLFKGEKGDQGEQGIQGVQGPKGDKGEAGVIKFIVVDKLPEVGENAIYLLATEGGAMENLYDEYIYVDGRWERIGSIGLEVDLSEYVKNTDYAANGKAGVVKISGWSGVTMVTKETIGLSVPSENDIKNRSEHRAILCKSLDKAVKVGLTTNTETLTDEEKAAACEWVGITALAIPNIISGGGKSISVNDVSPLAHNCSCRLTSDTYEEIIGGSNNLIDLQSVNAGSPDGIEHQTLTTTVNPNGSIILNGELPSDTALRLSIPIIGFEKGKQYTISLRTSKNEQKQFQFLGFGSDGSPTVGWDEIYHTTKYTFVWDENTVKYIIDCMFDSTIETGESITYDNLTIYVQIEEGSTMTEWKPSGGEVETKPYIEDFSTVTVNVDGNSYTPQADGTVTGIVSVSPDMEVTTDNEHVNIHDFTYNVDTKTYIDKAVGTYELVEEITVTEAGMVYRETTPSGEAYSSLYKNMLVSVYNQTSMGCDSCFIYRGNALSASLGSVDAGVYGVFRTEMIAPDIAEWTKSHDSGYLNYCYETTENVSSVALDNCSVGTVIKIYGARA